MAIQVALALKGARANEPQFAIAVWPDDADVEVDEVVVVGGVAAVDSVGIVARRARRGLADDVPVVFAETLILNDAVVDVVAFVADARRAINP
jgi:hypothetical protein